MPYSRNYGNSKYRLFQNILFNVTWSKINIFKKSFFHSIQLPETNILLFLWLIFDENWPKYGEKTLFRFHKINRSSKSKVGGALFYFFSQICVLLRTVPYIWLPKSLFILYRILDQKKKKSGIKNFFFVFLRNNSST